MCVRVLEVVLTDLLFKFVYLRMNCNLDVVLLRMTRENCVISRDRGSQVDLAQSLIHLHFSVISAVHER